MPPTDAVEAKILKTVDDAAKALAKLRTDLAPLARTLKELDVDEGKSLAAMKKAQTAVHKFAAVTKLKTSDAFSSLSAQAQAQVVWIDGLMAKLVSLTGDLDQAKKDSKFDAEKRHGYFVRLLKQLTHSAPQLPMKVRQLIKQIEKDKDLDGFDKSLVPFLPMALTLWLISDTVVDGLAARPK